jgi:transcription factor CRZ1
LYQNSQLNQGAFRQHQPLAFQNNQTFPFLLNSKEVPYSNDGSNMHSDFSNTNFALDPTFDSTQQNINPASLSRMPSHASTPPHLLSPEHQHSPGQPGSPASTQGQFYTPQHSRHQSLDPASAAYPQGGPTDWQGMSFQQHRRAPSDHSELSSNAPSPFLPHAELGESIETNHSPMIGAQHDGLNAFGIEDFSINDQQQAQVSPGHSPYMSPRLMAQPNQGLGMGSEFMLQQGMQPLMLGPGPEIYTTQAEDSFHSMPHMHDRNHSIPSDMGQADQFPAPTINIEPAPVSRQVSFEPETNNLGDTLSPPASMYQPS